MHTRPFRILLRRVPIPSKRQKALVAGHLATQTLADARAHGKLDGLGGARAHVAVR